MMSPVSISTQSQWGLQRAQQVIGDGAHVPLGATRGDDQPIGHGAFALEIDHHHILGLVIVQAAQDQVFQGLDTVLGFRNGGLGAGGFLRARRGFTIQRETPLRSTQDPP